MKKFIVILSALLFIFTCTLNAQSSLIVTDYANGQTVIPNNGIISIITSSGSSEMTTINIKNTSANTKIYNLKRFDDILNSGAAAYFKIGSNFCFPPATTVTPISVTLTPNGTTNDNLNSQNLMYLLHLDESVTPGISHIRYEIYDINNPTDAFTFTIYYNDAVTSVKNHVASFANISEVFPNPGTEKKYLTISSEKNRSDLALTISDEHGKLISTQKLNLEKGQNTISLDVESLNVGIYFIVIRDNKTSVTRKLIIQ